MTVYVTLLGMGRSAGMELLEQDVLTDIVLVLAHCLETEIVLCGQSTRMFGVGGYVEVP